MLQVGKASKDKGMGLSGDEKGGSRGKKNPDE